MSSSFRRGDASLLASTGASRDDADPTVDCVSSDSSADGDDRIDDRDQCNSRVCEVLHDAIGFGLFV